MMNLLRIYFLSMIMMLAVLASANVIDNLDRLHFADGLYTRRMYKLAIPEYEGYLKDSPKSEKADIANFRLAECFRLTGDSMKAERLFRTVFVNYPKSEFRYKAGFKRADIFMAAKQFQAAVDLYNEVLKTHPPEDIAAACDFFIGEAYLSLGKKSEAYAQFKKVTKQHSKSSFYSYALLKLGSVRSETGKQKEALDLYQKVIDRPESDRVAAEALFQMAELYFKAGDFDKSAKAYDELLSKYPSDQRSQEAKLQSGWASHNAGLYAEALSRAVLDLKTESNMAKKEEWLYLKANCERQLMRNTDAVKTYDALLQLNSKSSFAHAAQYEKALTFYKAGSFSEAVSAAKKIELTDDLKKDIYWLLAESYSALKDNNNAIQYYRLITRDFSTSDIACEANFRLAHILRLTGEYKEASRYYTVVAEKFSSNKLAPKALFASALCFSEMKMYEDAARDWGAVIQKFPKDPIIEEAYYRKAMTDIRLDRQDEALASLHAMIQKFPKSEFIPDAYYWSGVLLQRKSKMQDAEGMFELALTSSPRKDLEREIQFALGSVLNSLGKSDDAANIYQHLIDSPAKNKFQPSTLEWLSEYWFNHGKYSESVEVAKLLITQSEQPEAKQTGWCLVGNGLRMLKDVDGAVKAYKSALDIKVNTSFAAISYLRLGDLLMPSGKHTEAATCYEKAAELTSGEDRDGIRARAYAGLARAKKADNDLESAARYFMSVAILYDDPSIVPACMQEAALAYKALGKEDESQKVLNELKLRYPDFAKLQPQKR